MKTLCQSFGHCFNGFLRENFMSNLCQSCKNCSYPQIIAAEDSQSFDFEATTLNPY
jgi:hypothetical protein